MRTERHQRRHRALPMRLGLTLCLAGTVLSGCDSEDALDESELSERILETRDEAGSAVAASSTPSDPDVVPEDECGMGAHSDAVVLRWDEGSPGEPSLDVHLHEPLGPGDQVEARFRLTQMPVGEQGVRDIGARITLEGRQDQRISLPAELLEVIDSAEPHVAFVLVTLCRADDPQGNCLQHTSEELYIEDGRAMRPEAYEKFLREKWAATKPWLFDEGHPTHIVDMKGR